MKKDILLLISFLSLMGLLVVGTTVDAAEQKVYESNLGITFEEADELVEPEKPVKPNPEQPEVPNPGETTPSATTPTSDSTSDSSTTASTKEPSASTTRPSTGGKPAVTEKKKGVLPQLGEKKESLFVWLVLIAVSMYLLIRKKVNGKEEK